MVWSVLRRPDRRALGDPPGAVGEYLAEMRNVLRGPSRVKADVLSELRDGLEDISAGYEDSGLDSAEAGRQAVAEFGAVKEIAPELQEELAYAQGRRTGWLLSFLVLLQALIAELLWQANPQTAWPEFTPSDGYLLLAKSLDVLQYLTVPVGMAAIVVFGWGGRATKVRPGMVRAVGVYAGLVLFLKSVAAFLLVALVPGLLSQSYTAWDALLQQLVVWVIPTCYVMVSAWSCLRSASLRRALEG